MNNIFASSLFSTSCSIINNIRSYMDAKIEKGCIKYGLLKFATGIFIGLTVLIYIKHKFKEKTLTINNKKIFARLFNKIVILLMEGITGNFVFIFSRIIMKKLIFNIYVNLYISILFPFLYTKILLKYLTTHQSKISPLTNGSP